MPPGKPSQTGATSHSQQVPPVIVKSSRCHQSFSTQGAGASRAVPRARAASALPEAAAAAGSQRQPPLGSLWWCALSREGGRLAAAQVMATFLSSLTSVGSSLLPVFGWILGRGT